jgi:hypothetical protein
MDQEDEWMPLDEREKRELAARIKEQRRTVWSGTTKAKRRTKNRRDLRTARLVLDHQKGHREVEQISDHQSDEPEAERKSSGFQLSIPSLKLALLVIIGLIAAILIGVAIGYVAAVRDWINI